MLPVYFSAFGQIFNSSDNKTPRVMSGERNQNAAQLTTKLIAHPGAGKNFSFNNHSFSLNDGYSQLTNRRK